MRRDHVYLQDVIGSVRYSGPGGGSLFPINWSMKMKNVFVMLLLFAIAFPASAVNSRDVAFPSREVEKVMPLLSQCNEESPYDYIESILGQPDEDMGSGMYILEFKLEDGTSITVGTPDKKEVWYIYRTGPGIDDDVIQVYKKAE